MTAKEFFSNDENIHYIKKVSKSFYQNSILIYYLEEEDYIQEQMMTIARKIRFYKEDKCQLNTYLIMCLKNKHGEIFRKMVSDKRKVNNPLYLHYLDRVNENETDSYNYLPTKEEDSTLEFILEDYKKILTEEEIEIIRYKYYGYSGKEIANKMDSNEKHIEYKMYYIRKKLNKISGE